MRKRILLPILVLSLLVLAMGLTGCNRERPAPTPVSTTASPKLDTPSPAPPGAAVTKVVLPGQTPVSGGAATPVPLTPVSPSVSAATPVPVATSASGGAQTKPSTETTYVVQRGDTLGRIAQRYGVTTKQITDLNGITNPNMIVPGQKLKIPAAEPTSSGTSSGTQSGGQKTYTVRAGDTLATIAVKYGVTVQALQKANNLTNADQIYSGQVLKIP